MTHIAASQSFGSKVKDIDVGCAITPPGLGYITIRESNEEGRMFGIGSRSAVIHLTVEERRQLIKNIEATIPATVETATSAPEVVVSPKNDPLLQRGKQVRITGDDHGVDGSHELPLGKVLTIIAAADSDDELLLDDGEGDKVYVSVKDCQPVEVASVTTASLPAYGDLPLDYTLGLIRHLQSATAV